MLFVGAFALLQYGWEMARNSALEQLVIHEATVKTASALISLVTPHIDVRPVGASIVASGGGLHVLRGCEGVEVLFLLMAALLAHPFDWRARLAGMAGGLLLIFALNELRLVALFYSYRQDHALFDLLHGLVTPLVMVAVVVLFFLGLLHWQEQLGTRT
jgi:exosortase/archaeosortase family protein